MTHSAEGDLPLDSVLRGTYKIVSVLGQGGMGSVFLAQHLRLPGKQVAVKVLRGGKHLSPDIYARFRREAEIASRLGHPNIVEVLDFDTLDDGSPFLVLEFLRGESLADRLWRGRLSREEVFSYVRQMGSALHVAHRAGIVHRDLKPANIFLVPTDSGGVVGERVKLLDFGISKVMSSETLQTQEAVLIGTPQYMSPEQALGRNKQIDARTDIFALGSIVFEMLAGVTPFGGGGLTEIIYRIVHEPPASLEELAPQTPPQVIAAVMRALSKKPEDRHPDVAAFIHDLTGSPLQSLPGAGEVHGSRDGARTGPSGIARPADDAVSMSATLPPGSQSSPLGGSGTAQYGQAPVGADGTMGFGATLAPGASSGGQAPASGTLAYGAGGVAPANGGQAPVGGTLAYGSGAVAAGAGVQAPTGGTLASASSGVASPTGVQVPASGTLAPGAAGAAVVQGAGGMVASPGAQAPIGGSQASGAAGAVPAASTGSKSRAWMIAAGVALLAGAVGVGRFLRPAEPQTPPPPVEAPAPKVTEVVNPAANVPPATEPAQQPAPVVNSAPPATEPAQQPAPAVAAVTPPETQSPVKPVTSRQPGPAALEVLPEAVRQMLEEGERSLAAGNTDEARRLALLSQRTKDSTAARSLLARTYCKRGDLGGAKSELRKLPAAEQTRVKRFCMKHDVEL
ncbi:protein kinase [Myxococcaceae bacterium GXIMD 01537]